MLLEYPQFFFYATCLIFMRFREESMAGIFVIPVIYLLLCPCLSAQAQKTFVFPRLSGLTRTNLSSLYFHGSAVIEPDLIGIRLSNQSEYLTGTVLYSEPLRMKEELGSKNATLSFSTTFIFAMAPPPPDVSQSAEGLWFIITPNKTHQGGLAGSYLRLLNFTSMGQPYNHLFAVEFDTYKNEEFNDINDNHVGVDLNSLVSVESKSAGFWDGNQSVELDLNGRQNIQAWIDYDHLQDQLNVSIAVAGSIRPEKPLISHTNLSLPSILEEEMYVGFVAGTGKFVQEHYVLAWSFTTNGTAPALNASILPFLKYPESSNRKSRLIAGITTSLVVFIVLVIAIIWFRRRKNIDLIEDWELEYWPHRISYKDLSIATDGFSEKQVLGFGGFGKVYKGILPTNGLQVAVKSIFRETSEGVKEFIAEISSLGRLQHRNLVQIRGYCRRGQKFFIVYDFMGNGSLDKMISRNPGRVLGWAQRYAILKDVGAGLLYLHEGWEQRVVHRDIKSSNVLLDSELHGKLGDFGLARLYGHDENSQSTRVAGTPGYIAPELLATGKASSSTDVFSFGVLMLEVACGRRPVDFYFEDSQLVLLDWVRELYGNGRLMDAADPKLGGCFVEEEMERVLQLGLLCCNPEGKRRPGIRQVVQILEGEVSLQAPHLQLSFEMSISGPVSIRDSSFSESM